MQVILRDRVAHLGEAGETVTVKPGYARNYLIPKGFAYAATAASLRQIEQERSERDAREAATLDGARAQAATLGGVSLTFRMRAAQEGKLFGSITSADIVEQLERERGIVIDRRQVELDEPIKALGVFSVPVRLHTQVRPELKIWVIQED